MKAIAPLVLAACLMSAVAGAQTTPTPPPQSPEQQGGAPSVPGLVTTPAQGASPAAAANAAAQTTAAPAGPANICRELVGFYEARAKAAAAPPPAAPAATPAAAPAAPPKPLPVTPEEAQGLAGANDIPGCRDAAVKLRRAGIALPAGLIALAALKVELLQAAPQ